MKQLEIKTNKRLLIVEDYTTGNLDNYYEKYRKENPGKYLKFICKGTDLTEDIAKGFQHKNMGIAHNGEYLSAIEEFKFHISNHGYHWGENPVKEPRMSDYGWYASGHPEEDSGWMYEDGEDKYYESLKLFEESESRTFNPSKCIIFEIL